MSAYDDYMSIAKRQAQAGSLQQALEALRSAQEIDDNDKVRRRIKKIQEAIEAEEETSEEESDFGFQVCKSKVGFLLTDEFLPEVSQDWDQVLANGFLHRVPRSI